MLIIDAVIVCITVAVAYWGYREGLNAKAFALVGFGAGAILGSRVAPLVLDGGLHDPFAPVLALPAALVVGAIMAAALERVAFSLRGRFPGGRRGALAGAALAGALGLVMVWLLSAVAARVDGVRDSVRDSAIVERLNAVLPAPGPLLNPERQQHLDPLPKLTGPAPNIGPADPAIRRDPQVRAASRSVVKVLNKACGHRGSGSGWVARAGTVVTNAHVVRASEQTTVLLQGKGDPLEAQPIWYDDVNDIAILRVPGLAGVPALRLDLTPQPGAFVAALGFPGGGPYKLKPARLGSTSKAPRLRVSGRKVKPRVTWIRAAGVVPGSSGGPVVDGSGQVATMVFAGRSGGRSAVGVPTPVIRRALGRAGPPVDTGSCADG